ncbi:Methyltransferase domain-containing protein [Lachnospiraceae bacterium XBD2001]|uniref:class I SAM-dependent methyltransferase n=1 Tax=Butyrivibrio sp. FCS014 TaxID=1408304 RepID=UPI0004640A31|nr:class I SAM-dependent methyltransferase [Butyrivibrio sp. FCS014]SFT57978.1 Methyltransferase domain-containing protein [Lachnospiraceae bacterium XBD2001]
MNKDQEKINELWTRGAKNYNRIIDDEINSFRSAGWKKQILSQVKTEGELEILDCGCGPGFFSCIMAQEGHHVTGIDGSELMLSFAIQRAKELGLSVNYKLMDCHELDFEDNSFDLIISRNVTHTLRDHKAVYSQWMRVLKPGGVLLIFDANWHLSRYGYSEHDESVRRYVECMKKYGSDFSGNIYDGNEEALLERFKKHSPDENEVWDNVLKDKIRPDWDAGLLHGIGFANVDYDRDIIEDLWDDKEKCIYGNTPMFMIRAEKPREL